MGDHTLRRITEPKDGPLLLDDMKLHLRLDTHEESILVDSWILAALEKAESFTQRQMMTCTWEMYMEEFPSGGQVIRMPKPPLVNVHSIKYVDPDGVTQTLAATVYDIDTDADPGVVRLAYNQSWPNVRPGYKAVTMNYLAGYGTLPTDPPQVIKAGMQLLVAHWFENREAVSMGMSGSELPMGVKDLWWPKRNNVVGYGAVTV